MANAFELFMEAAGKIPAVRISREEFLRKTFRLKISNPVFLERIVEKGPLAAGVVKGRIDKIADSVINSTTVSVTGTSVVTGLPGGLAMLATVPADITQLYVHMFIIIQKLMYLYGWQDDVFDEAGNIDDDTKKLIVLYVGLMTGVGAVTKPLANLAAKATANVINKALLKHLSMKTIWIILRKIGIKTTGKVFVKYLTKGIPVISGILSGAITLATFVPMANKLKRYLSEGFIDMEDMEDIDDADEYLEENAEVENSDE